MPYERTKFGNGLAAGTAGSNVTQDVQHHYGIRRLGGAAGVSKTEGFQNELTIDLTPNMIRGQTFLTLPAKIPALSKPLKVYLEVETPFVLGGTTPAVRIGTKGSEATNGVTLTQAQLQAAGMYDITASLAGTWAAAGGLTAETVVGVAFSGTTPTVTNVGKARVIIEYVKA